MRPGIAHVQQSSSEREERREKREGGRGKREERREKREESREKRKERREKSEERREQRAERREKREELNDVCSSDGETCSGGCSVAVGAVDAAVCLPGNETPPALFTEHAQCEHLNDECDEEIGTFHGVVQ